MPCRDFSRVSTKPRSSPSDLLGDLEGVLFQRVQVIGQRGHCFSSVLIGTLEADRERTVRTFDDTTAIVGNSDIAPRLRRGSCTTSADRRRSDSTGNRSAAGWWHRSLCDKSTRDTNACTSLSIPLADNANLNTQTSTTLVDSSLVDHLQIV